MIELPQSVSELMAVRDRLFASGDEAAVRQAKNIDGMLAEVAAGTFKARNEVKDVFTRR